MISELSSVTGDLVKSILDTTVLRHKVISNNIANHNTPGYVPQQVDFESILSVELSQQDHIRDDSRVRETLDFIQPEIMARDENILSGDSENALDKEISDMAENTLKYEALIRRFE